jgi:hypothetical protein
MSESASEEVITEHETETADPVPMPPAPPIAVVAADVVPTSEVMPQHTTCYTVIVSPDDETEGPTFAELLPLDPLRVRATLSVTNSGVVLCHSRTQAQDPINQDAMAVGANGARLAANTTLTLIGTNQLWVAAAGTTYARAAVIVERRTP